eukprot:1158550-Pelagomonas_calceolata.AAC.4
MQASSCKQLQQDQSKALREEQAKQIRCMQNNALQSAHVGDAGRQPQTDAAGAVQGVVGGAGRQQGSFEGCPA